MGNHQVAAVTGPVSSADLAPILYHEHVVLDMRKVARLHDLWLPGVDIMVEELREYARHGGRTVISLTNGSMGRDVAALAEISIRSGVTILAATGQYTRLASHGIADAGVLHEVFVRELLSGIDDTSVCAAVIGEIATGPAPISTYETRLFEAAARAHLTTGAPIATHTHNGRYAMWQLRCLMSHQVPPARIVIGHMDASLRNGKPDIDLMSEIAAHGAFVGLDTIGIANYYSENLKRFQPSDESRADAIAELVERGWSDNIIVSHDICRRMHLKSSGGFGYGHMYEVFLPMLQARGIGRDIFDRFVINNPIRWLTA